MEDRRIIYLGVNNEANDSVKKDHSNVRRYSETDLNWSFSRSENRE